MANRSGDAAELGVAQKNLNRLLRAAHLRDKETVGFNLQDDQYGFQKKALRRQTELNHLFYAI